MNSNSYIYGNKFNPGDLVEIIELPWFVVILCSCGEILRSGMRGVVLTHMRPCPCGCGSIGVEVQFGDKSHGLNIEILRKISPPPQEETELTTEEISAHA